MCLCTYVVQNKCRALSLLSPLYASSNFTDQIWHVEEEHENLKKQLEMPPMMVYCQLSTADVAYKVTYLLVAVFASIC